MIKSPVGPLCPCGIAPHLQIQQHFRASLSLDSSALIRSFVLESSVPALPSEGRILMSIKSDSTVVPILAVISADTW